jgi:hypothetical protein
MVGIIMLVVSLPFFAIMELDRAIGPLRNRIDPASAVILAALPPCLVGDDAGRGVRDESCFPGCSAKNEKALLRIFMWLLP